MFDKTNRDSFDRVDEWVSEVHKESSENQVKILVGKVDQKSEISSEEANIKTI